MFPLIPASKKAFFYPVSLQQGDFSYVLLDLVPDVKESTFHVREVKRMIGPSCRHSSSSAM